MASEDVSAGAPNHQADETAVVVGSASTTGRPT